MRAFFFILLIYAACISNAFSQEDNVAKYLPEINSSVADIVLSGHINVPSTYDVIPFVEHKNISDGVVWGENDSLEKIENDQLERGTKEIIDPVFIAKLSYGTSQASIEKDANDGIYELIIEQTKSYGILNIEPRHLSMGNLPVLEITGKRADGRFFAMAWVGLNSETNKTLFIDYRVPFKNDPQSVKQLWENFIHKSELDSRKR